MKSDKSAFQIRDPKLQIGLSQAQSNLRFLNFGSEMQDSSDFKISILVLQLQFPAHATFDGSFVNDLPDCDIFEGDTAGFE